MTHSNIKVGDKVRYTGHSEYDLTHGGVYQVVEVGDWWFGVTDDVGDYNTIDRNECEPVTDAPHMTYKQAYEKFTADAKQDTPDYNDGNWHGWNGGECPVHPQSSIQWSRFCLGESGIAYQGACNAKHARWDYITAFRVTKPYVEPRNLLEVWVIYDEDGYYAATRLTENNANVYSGMYLGGTGTVVHMIEADD